MSQYAQQAIGQCPVCRQPVLPEQWEEHQARHERMARRERRARRGQANP